jgi:SAM-dependent methyltransferase
MTATYLSFAQKAKKHWTPERIRKVTAGKRYIVDPVGGSELLRTIGLLNADASMSADAVRKYSQINHMVLLLEPTLLSLAERFSGLKILDCGCGNSYLTLLLAWCFKNVWRKSAIITGIDTRDDVIKKSRARAAELDLSEFLEFETLSVQQWAERRSLIELPEERKATRPHLVVALHACNTATDDALALVFAERADAFAVAPCCQAELAQKWRQLSSENFKNAFSVLIQSPELRRDSCSTFTDAMRILLARGSGYEVTSTEFVPSGHTPKNRLIMGIRRGNYLDSALAEYAELEKMLGAGIGLAQRLPPDVASRMVQNILR